MEEKKRLEECFLAFKDAVIYGSGWVQIYESDSGVECKHIKHEDVVKIRAVKDHLRRRGIKSKSNL